MMLDWCRNLFGIPRNPYASTEVRVVRDNLVEYVPGPHTILSKLPFTFPGYSVNIVVMPGYSMKDDASSKNLFVLQFSDSYSDTVHLVLVNMDSCGKLSWSQCHSMEELERRLGKRAYRYFRKWTKYNYSVLSVR